MKTKLSLLLVLGLSLCFAGEQTAFGQTVPGAAANADPARLRAIVEAEAQKAGTKAVVFGMWVRDRPPPPTRPPSPFSARSSST